MAPEDSRFSEVRYPEWQNEYRAALLELDKIKLFERVATAQTAIYKRLQQIAQSSDHQAETKAIEDALSALRVVMTDRLDFPDWEKNDSGSVAIKKLSGFADQNIDRL